ncbi:Uncharacterised protein [Shigella sonnei]|nr:Uncharacterised protein [Shigella sonnei]CSP73083.1 Uncharacterised protein [Shigella sonnei]CSR55065.1 Uncharacterised protein [Shigella sonnei]
MTHTKDALTCLTYHGESFRDQIFQHFAFFQTCTKLCGFPFQFFVGEFFHLRFHGIDDVDHFAHPAQGAIVTTTENFS